MGADCAEVDSKEADYLGDNREEEAGCAEVGNMGEEDCDDHHHDRHGHRLDHRLDHRHGHRHGRHSMGELAHPDFAPIGQQQQMPTKRGIDLNKATIPLPSTSMIFYFYYSFNYSFSI